jgi:hypothetical protein
MSVVWQISPGIMMLILNPGPNCFSRRIFTYSKKVLYNGYRVFPGLKRPGRGADHPPISSAEVEHEYSYTSTPPLGPWWPVIGWPLPFFKKVLCHSKPIFCCGCARLAEWGYVNMISGLIESDEQYWSDKIMNLYSHNYNQSNHPCMYVINWTVKQALKKHKHNQFLSVSVYWSQRDALFVQFIENQRPLHVSSITFLFSGGATQTAFGIMCAYNVSTNTVI